jgi:hypothetical protein
LASKRQSVQTVWSMHVKPCVAGNHGAGNAQSAASSALRKPDIPNSNRQARRSRGRSCTGCAHEIGHSGTSDELGGPDMVDLFVSEKCVLFQQTAGSPSPRAVDRSAFRGRGKTTARGVKERPAHRRPAARKERQRGGRPVAVAWCGVHEAVSLPLLPAPWIST